jgi:hypothetical protein
MTFTHRFLSASAFRRTGALLVSGVLLAPAAVAAAIPSSSPVQPETLLAVRGADRGAPTQPMPAQSATPQDVPPADADALEADDRRDAHDVRAAVDEVLRQYPPALREVLRLDPSLLSDEGYLAAYPALAGVLRRHPQVVRSPSFYFGEPARRAPTDPRSQAIGLWRETTESLAVLAGMLLVFLALAWLIRTVLDHRRWLRTSRVQVDLQQKLVDRLASNEDLLAYLQTSSGQRLLDARPAPGRDPEPRAVIAPLNRILWSVQIGVVLIPFGLGLQWVARHLIEEVAQFLWFVGTMAVTVGIGFVISAGVAYLISRRLGLIVEPAAIDARPGTEPAA